MLATVVLATVFLLTRLYSGELTAAQQHLADIAQKHAALVEAGNQRAVDVAKTLAISQQNGLLGEREISLTQVRGVLEQFPEFTGAYVAYEPGADDALNLGYASDEAAEVSSYSPKERFIPYWFRDNKNNDAITLTSLVDMNSSYYYRGLKNRHLGLSEDEGISLAGGVSDLYRQASPSELRASRYIITEPYMYEGKFIVEQTVPIIVGDEFVGLAGVDRALDFIDDFLVDLKNYETQSYILISERGRVISATTHAELRSKVIEATPYGDILKPIYLATDGALQGHFEDPFVKADYIFASAKVPTGNWTLVVSVAESELLAAVSRAFYQVIAIVIIGALLALPLSFWLVRKLVMRVELAAVAAEKVAKGNLTEPVSSDAEDESGLLLRSIGNMVDSLNTLVIKMKSSSIQIMSAATDIGTSAEKQKVVSNDFSASTNEIAASISQISTTAKELLATMQDVASASQTTSEVANAGRDDLDRMEALMNSLADSTGSISNQLAVISERANNIGAVVTTISKVADQTNLLSLNAAIEAEKAGEHGLGFSVVAREIRRLADQTATATLDIGKIVQEMQSSVSSGVMEMDRFGEQVRNGVDEAIRLGDQLGVIIESVESLQPRFESAHEGMTSQALGATQINEAMLQLRSVVGASMNSSEDLASTSEQLMASVSDLRAEIAKFKTK